MKIIGKGYITDIEGVKYFTGEEYSIEIVLTNNKRIKINGLTGEEMKEIQNRIRTERLEVEVKIYKEKEILDDEEKKYLRGVIKPFRSKIDYIVKNSTKDKREEYISIILKTGEMIELPLFKRGGMYKYMKKYKEYTLEELGL